MTKHLSLQMLFTSWLFLLASSGVEAKTDFPQHSPVPGGVALVSIPRSLTSDASVPKVYFEKNRVMVLPTNEPEAQWIAVIGIPLSAKPGPQQLQFMDADAKENTLVFEVKPKTYEEQRIQLNNKRQVNPLKQDLERIQREQSEMVSAFKSWHSTSLEFSRFELPTKGEISSPFGLRRFFNDQPRNPHSGLDIAAPEGTPIYAPASGQVMTTGNYFFNGNTVLINHNNGLVTMYCHMHDINVAPGDSLEKGALLGFVGKTGRATGAHLHWSVSLNNTRVDPVLLLDHK
ncbi:MAG: peptidoglycan DD-metalloendopeptidase family protein [Pseudomonadales bacterium]